MTSSRYARVEREHRWLLRSAPDLTGDAGRSIVDRYIKGTRLRLRSVTTADGIVVRKLGHKTTPDAAHPSTVQHTSLYLDEAEHALLAALPAAELRKTRYVRDVAGRAVSVDVFAGPLAGLVLAEMEVDADEQAPAPPYDLVREVTDEVAYTGGALARHGLPPPTRASG